MVFFLLVAAWAQADTAPMAVVMTSSNGPKWSWRDLVQEKIEALPSQPIVSARAPELSPLLVHAEPDVDVVTLPPYRVRGNRVEAELHRMFVQQDKQARQDFLMRRLGVAAHTVHYGRFGGGVVTVFYVPVFAGFGFSW